MHSENQTLMSTVMCAFEPSFSAIASHDLSYGLAHSQHTARMAFTLPLLVKCAVLVLKWYGRYRSAC